ncbi:MAG: hypothetical protein AVDCRST_MAG86-4089, partial [uncultured Truepera sp.]
VVFGVQRSGYPFLPTATAQQQRKSGEKCEGFNHRVLQG